MASDKLADLVRELRAQLYQRDRYCPAHEREWETMEKEARRERDNAETLAEWDAETEAMIAAATG